MQYDVKTPQAYLDALEDDWRKQKLLNLRQLILDSNSELQEVINYKMLGYRLGEELVFHLNAQKNYLGLYVGNISKIDPSGSLLADYNLGKGCIRISKTKAEDSPNMIEFIHLATKLAATGGDHSC